MISSTDLIVAVIGSGADGFCIGWFGAWCAGAWAEVSKNAKTD